MVILAVGLLGLAGLQSTSLKLNDSSMLRTKAQMMANDLLDRARAHRNDIDRFDTNGQFRDDNWTTSFNPLDDWISNQVATLPDGQARVDCDAGTNLCDVEVEWNDQRGESNTSDADGTAETQRFEIEVEV